MWGIHVSFPGVGFFAREMRPSFRDIHVGKILYFGQMDGLFDRLIGSHDILGSQTVREKG